MSNFDPFLEARAFMLDVEKRLDRGAPIDPSVLIDAAARADATLPTTAAGAVVKLKDLSRFMALPGDSQEPWEWQAKVYISDALASLKRSHPSSALYLRLAVTVIPTGDTSRMALAVRGACAPLLAPTAALAA